MMPRLQTSKKRRGFSYLAILIPIAVLGIVLAASLKLTGNQNYASTRSQSWNLSLVIAECGVEEALAHLNSATTTNFEANGWTRSGSTFTKRTYMSSNIYYDVMINASNLMYPVITARGNVPAVENHVR
jgi:hypothetical protein